jgi:hypothetical protein
MEQGPFTVIRKSFTGDDILNTVQRFVEGVAFLKDQETSVVLPK